jgi:hypothetical protein
MQPGALRHTVFCATTGVAPQPHRPNTLNTSQGFSGGTPPLCIRETHDYRRFLKAGNDARNQVPDVWVSRGSSGPKLAVTGLQIGETRSNFFVDNSTSHVQLRVPKIKISTSSLALHGFFKRC